MAERKTSRKIERETPTAWWCPFDDHSNMQGTNVCGGCGSERDGDTVKLPKHVADMIDDDDSPPAPPEPAEADALTAAITPPTRGRQGRARPT